MNTEKESDSYVQCLNCGDIYITRRKIPVSASIVKCECPRCGWHKGLNCGDKEEDIYLYYDNSLDERFYTY